MYEAMYAFVEQHLIHRSLDVIELGGSNRVFARIFSGLNHRFRVAADFPTVDICDMKIYTDASFDAVVLDQVLEHVECPNEAIAEVHRILRPGGHCFASTPFLMFYHWFADYWRFSERAYQTLFAKFSAITIGAWGNADFAAWQIKQKSHRPSWKRCMELGLPIHNERGFPVIVWGIARK